MRYVAVVILLSAISVSAQAPTPEFEVASIKRNMSETRTVAPPASPYRGQFAMSWTTARAMVSLAYHEPLPEQIIGLPGWAEAERYDIVAQGRPNATEQEQTQMWRALFADRLKLRVHYEERQLAGYKLVVARPDGRLGSQLKPYTCTRPDPGPRFIEMDNAARLAARAIQVERRAATPEEERAIKAMCTLVPAGNTIYAAGATMESLALIVRVLGRLDGPVIDGTGLQGTYELKMTFSVPSGGPPSPDDAPTLLSALPDQLGLKLQTATVPSTVLVIDHIERPSEN